MQSIWMAIAPERGSSRILAMTGPDETILKAKLLSNPAHPRAVATLLEAIALWQGRKVRAALCADVSNNSSVTSRYPDMFSDPDQTPLYDLSWVPALGHPRRRHRDELSGMGRFHDLRQMLLFEVAR